VLQFLYCLFIQHKVNAIAMLLEFLHCDCIDFTLWLQHFMLIAFDLVLNSFRLLKQIVFIHFSLAIHMRTRTWLCEKVVRHVWFAWSMVRRSALSVLRSCLWIPGEGVGENTPPRASRANSIFFRGGYFRKRFKDCWAFRGFQVRLR